MFCVYSFNEDVDVDGDGFCQSYRGAACAKYVGLKSIFVKNKLQQGSMEEKLTGKAGRVSDDLKHFDNKHEHDYLHLASCCPFRSKSRNFCCLFMESNYLSKWIWNWYGAIIKICNPTCQQITFCHSRLLKLMGVCLICLHYFQTRNPDDDLPRVASTCCEGEIKPERFHCHKAST